MEQVEMQVNILSISFQNYSCICLNAVNYLRTIQLGSISLLIGSHQEMHFMLRL